MKKSGTKLSVNLLILSLTSVIALTACERRERPTKPSSANTENNLGANLKNAPVDGATNENGEASPEPSAYVAAAQALQTEQAQLIAKGYKIDFEAGTLDTRDVVDAHLKLEKATRDTADLTVACDLKRVKDLNQEFIDTLANTRIEEGVSADEYLKNNSESEAMVQMIDAELRLIKLENPDCSLLNPNPALMTDISADDDSAE